MVVAASSYEECRRQRLEENKKRMEQLNLHKLAFSLKTSPSKSPISSPVKRFRGLSDQGTPLPVRRSSRMADKPLRNYKEDALEPMRRERRVYSYKRRDLSNRVYASAEERQYTIDQAVKMEPELEFEGPCCIKPMLQSHVTGGFWLSLPLPFCKPNLPDHDECVTLVDENGDEWPTRYLAKKNGLSGGWRGFAIDHELVDGDCLIFQLIKPNTLKVHIIRVNPIQTDEEEGPDENREDAEDAKDANLSKKESNIKNKSRVKSPKSDKEEGHNENQEDAEDAKLNRRRSSRVNKSRCIVAC